MREILFRGKTEDNSDWVFGWFEKYPFGRWPLKTAIIPTDDAEDGYFHHVKVIHETVGQYTGLSDKNGKRIFEGDILVMGNCREYPVLVKFLDSSWQCVIPNQNAYIHYRHRLENNDTKYEVIGNIHDNPELLEEGDS